MKRDDDKVRIGNKSYPPRSLLEMANDSTEPTYDVAFSNTPWPPRPPRQEPWWNIPPPLPSPQFPGLIPVIPRPSRG